MHIEKGNAAGQITLQITDTQRNPEEPIRGGWWTCKHTSGTRIKPAYNQHKKMQQAEIPATISKRAMPTQIVAMHLTQHIQRQHEGVAGGNSKVSRPECQHDTKKEEGN